MLFLLSFLAITAAPTFADDATCPNAIAPEWWKDVTDTEAQIALGLGWLDQDLVYLLPEALALKIHQLKLMQEYGPDRHYPQIQRFIQREFTPERLTPLRPNQLYALFKLTAQLALWSALRENLAADTLEMFAEYVSHRIAAHYDRLSEEQKSSIRELLEEQIDGMRANLPVTQRMRDYAARFGDIPN